MNDESLRFTTIHRLLHEPSGEAFFTFFLCSKTAESMEVHYMGGRREGIGKDRQGMGGGHVRARRFGSG